MSFWWQNKKNSPAYYLPLWGQRLKKSSRALPVILRECNGRRIPLRSTCHSEDASPKNLIVFLGDPSAKASGWHEIYSNFQLINHSPEFLNSLRLLRNSSLSHKGRGNCFVANHSPVQLFNLSTHFTLHASLFTLIRTYRLIALQSYRLPQLSSLFTLHSSLW